MKQECGEKKGCWEKRFRLRAKALRQGHCPVPEWSGSRCDSRGGSKEESAGVGVGEEMESGSCRLEGHARTLGFSHVIGSHWKLWAGE